MGNYAGSLRCKIHVIKRLNLLFFKRHKTQHKTINQILPVELGPICTSSLSFPSADPHPCEARPAAEAHGCGLASPLGNRCEFPDRLQNHTRSDSPSVIRPDLTQVETSDIKTHVFPAGRSLRPSGVREVPGGVFEEGVCSRAGETEQLSPTLGPQILGVLPVDSKPPNMGRTQAQPLGMLRRESPMVAGV